MIKPDYLLLALLSIIWRSLNIVPINKFHETKCSTNADDEVWRSGVVNSVIKAHAATWIVWAATAIYFASTVSVRPNATRYVLGIPLFILILTLAVYYGYTARGKGVSQQNLFLGAPLWWRFPSASNLLVIEGILADLLLLVLRLGLLP
jgi:hypothetical protein